MGYIFSYTYNVGGQYPPDPATVASESFAPAKLPQRTWQKNVKFWVFAIQELPACDLSLQSGSSWQIFVEHFIKPHGAVLVYSYALYSNLLLVYAPPDVAAEVEPVEQRTNSFSFGGLVGAKGTIGLHVKLRNGNSLVFLGSHLVHGDKYADLRVQQVQQSQYCLFEDGKGVQKRLTVWMGDLNFRTNDKMHNCVTLDDGYNAAAFIDECDQLSRIMADKKAFVDFYEPKITFPPTYKFLPNTYCYTYSRLPSWCDRILIKGCNVKSRNDIYNIDGLHISDHLPVFSLNFILDNDFFAQ